MIIPKPNIVCVRDAAHARKMLQNHISDAPVVLLCVRPVQEEPAALACFAEEIYRTAQDCGAELALLYSDVPALAAAQFIRRRGARQVIVDAAQEPHTGFPETVRRLLPRAKIIVQGMETAAARCTEVCC